MILLPVAVLMCAYALVVFLWRGGQIARKQARCHTILQQTLAPPFVCKVHCEAARMFAVDVLKSLELPAGSCVPAQLTSPSVQQQKFALADEHQCRPPPHLGKLKGCLRMSTQVCYTGDQNGLVCLAVAVVLQTQKSLINTLLSLLETPPEAL